MNAKQFEQMKSGKGFIAALDQSGGSTPKALKLYGVNEDQYSSESEMFDLVHQMRTRIIKSPSFSSNRVIGVILFEMTMDRQIDGKGSAEFLWENKGIVPFLNFVNGFEAEVDGVQDELDVRAGRKQRNGVFQRPLPSAVGAGDDKRLPHVFRQFGSRRGGERGG